MPAPSTKRLVSVVAACLLGGCGVLGSTPRPAPTSPHCQRAKGSYADVKTPPGPFALYGFGFTVSSTRSCGKGDAMWLTAHGTRTLRNGRVRPKACPGRPDDPPTCARHCAERPLPEAACSVIPSIAVSHEAQARLTEERIVASVSLAGCGERTNEEGFWLPTLTVYDWRDADRAIAVLADRMRAWKARGAIRVAVQPMTCGVAL